MILKMISSLYFPMRMATDRVSVVTVPFLIGLLLAVDTLYRCSLISYSRSRLLTSSLLMKLPCAPELMRAYIVCPLTWISFSKYGVTEGAGLTSTWATSLLRVLLLVSFCIRLTCRDWHLFV
jgi:hypothetical protein